MAKLVQCHHRWMRRPCIVQLLVVLIHLDYSMKGAPGEVQSVDYTAICSIPELKCTAIHLIFSLVKIDILLVEMC